MSSSDLIRQAVIDQLGLTRPQTRRTPRASTPERSAESTSQSQRGRWRRWAHGSAAGDRRRGMLFSVLDARASAGETVFVFATERDEPPRPTAPTKGES